MHRSTLITLYALFLLAFLAPANAIAQMQGYGMMMGGGTAGEEQILSLSDAMQLLSKTGDSATVDKSRNQVKFTGQRIEIVIAAVQPNFPDTTFEVAGLVNPTLVIPAGSEVTITLINMDYGPRMNHGVVVTQIAPPYPVLSMMGMPDAFAGVRILAPRDAENIKEARYPEASATFNAPPPGVYYYLCQYYNHASKGMYGKLIVKGDMGTAQ